MISAHSFGQLKNHILIFFKFYGRNSNFIIEKFCLKSFFLKNPSPTHQINSHMNRIFFTFWFQMIRLGEIVLTAQLLYKNSFREGCCYSFNFQYFPITKLPRIAEYTYVQNKEIVVRNINHILPEKNS